ncbi:MAG: DUF308 domain-containing protein [Cyanobacteria bacterium P01_D01_bin.1]
MKSTDNESANRSAIPRETGGITKEQEARSEISAIGTVMGIVLIVLGIIAIAQPLFATIASTLIFGWLFIVAGIAQVVYSFSSGNLGQYLWKLLLGIIYLGSGILIITNLMSGALAITLVLGITIFAQGIIQVISAFAHALNSGLGNAAGQRASRDCLRYSHLVSVAF